MEEEGSNMVGSVPSETLGRGQGRWGRPNERQTHNSERQIEKDKNKNKTPRTGKKKYSYLTT